MKSRSQNPVASSQKRKSERRTQENLEPRTSHSFPYITIPRTRYTPIPMATERIKFFVR